MILRNAHAWSIEQASEANLEINYNQSSTCLHISNNPDKTYKSISGEG